jgi:hypothetical protein
MRAAGQCLQHVHRVAGVLRLAEDAIVEHDFGVGREHQRIGTRIARQRLPSRLRLVACHPPDVVQRRFLGKRHFRHVHVENGKRHAELPEQFAPAW